MDRGIERPLRAEPAVRRDFSFKNLHQIYNLLVSSDLEGARSAMMGFLLSTDRQCGSIRQRFYTIRALMMLAAFALKLDDAPIRNVRCETSDDGPGLLEKFCELLPLFSGQADTRRLQKKDERTQNIVSYFQEHFSARISALRRAASAFSISEKHLYTLLKENTGQTPAALLLELRLTHAAAQLRRSGKPIQVICEESGLPILIPSTRRSSAPMPSLRVSTAIYESSLRESGRPANLPRGPAFPLTASSGGNGGPAQSIPLTAHRGRSIMKADVMPREKETAMKVFDMVIQQIIRDLEKMEPHTRLPGRQALCDQYFASRDTMIA